MRWLFSIYKMDFVSHPERLPIYFKCIDAAFEYADIMDYKLVAPAKPEYHKAMWSEPYVMAYDVVMSLGMFHGIDPFTFDMLDDNEFSRMSISGDKFTRHEPFGFTLDPFGHILTPSRLNIGIYKRLPLFLQRLGRSLLKQLMLYEEFDAQGNLLDIDRTHIEKIYGPQNSWIYNKWYSNPKFLDNLDSLNDLRRDIRQKASPISKR